MDKVRTECCNYKHRTTIYISPLVGGGDVVFDKDNDDDDDGKAGDLQQSLLYE